MRGDGKRKDRTRASLVTDFVGVSVSIDMESSTKPRCVSAMTGVAEASTTPPTLVTLDGDSFLIGLSFLPAVLVGLAARLACGVDVALSHAPGRVLKAPRSRNTLPPAPIAGLLVVFVVADDLVDGVAPIPSGTTLPLPHACSKAANALEVSDSQGANSACLRLGVVLVLGAAPDTAAAA